ncbi:uncharacterized protein NPIL_590821 [Nephila pilipes]|uniref:Uncharacterized protein n=1 Tax=Nephila pilipes TaxID=299642 RepID=A0A8X6NR96_NEPPI|nr:uncharacterized protein NPIL_590821 [Nephila pilipes]
MYLDDILTGYSNLKEHELLNSELVQLFESAGMSLHKWNFSHSNSDLPDLQFDQLSEEDTVKTLGVLWNSLLILFVLKFISLKIWFLLKRGVLSQIARLFDPLGLLEPVISEAKFFMQSLWLLKIDWHEKLPAAVAKEWSTFVLSLLALEKTKSPRFVPLEDPTPRI